MEINDTSLWVPPGSPYNNTSIRGSTILSSPEFTAFYSTLMLTSLAGFLLSFLSMAALCKGVGIPRVLAVLLINQLLSCVIVAVINTIYSILGVLVVVSQSSDSVTIKLPPACCQFLIWVNMFGSIGRLWGLAVYSIVTLLTIRYGQKFLKYTLVVIVCIIGVWAISFIVNIHIMLPYPVYAVQFVDNVVCFPHGAIIPKSSRYPTLAIWIVFGGITPLTISITIPIITLCYIRRNTITEGANYNKRIAKLALFLVVGNVVNLLGNAVPGLVALYAEAPGVILAYLLISLSLLPTPIIIIVFMKPVRNKIRKMFCCFAYISTIALASNT